MKAILKSA